MKKETYYTIKKLADLAGVSVRTLHYYDQIGLLSPHSTANNGYRHYEETELLRLQQILFFRELDFPLEDIKNILSSQDFDMVEALRDQKKMIGLKKRRLERLVQTIDTTISKINKKTTMEDKELYNGLSEKELEAYTAEAKQKWGHTTAWKQSQERYGKLTKEAKLKIQKEGDDLMKEIALLVGESPESKSVQDLIERHFNNMRHFYEPSPEMYRGLAEMYVADPRFTAYFEKYATGLAQFMHDSMIVYCEILGVKK